MMAARCPLCSAGSYRLFSDRNRNRTVICEQCGLYYTTPLPDTGQTERFVRESLKYTQDQLAKQAFFKLRAEKLLDRVERSKTPGRLLDVGCAIGLELEAASDRGWKAIGLELAETSLAIALERGFDARGETLAGSQFADGSFDLVTLNHVLEHIPRPGPFLDEVRRVLAPEGLLFVAVPNVHTWWYYWKKDRYGWTFQDDHFVHFTTSTLREMVEKHGFAVQEIFTSRWLDYHQPPESRGWVFRTLDRLAMRYDLGIEIFCLAGDGRAD